MSSSYFFNNFLITNKISIDFRLNNEYLMAWLFELCDFSYSVFYPPRRRRRENYVNYLLSSFSFSYSAGFWVLTEFVNQIKEKKSQNRRMHIVKIFEMRYPILYVDTIAKIPKFAKHKKWGAFDRRKPWKVIKSVTLGDDTF